MASYSAHETDKSGYVIRWRVSFKIDGKWKQKYFTIEKEAKLFCLEQEKTEILTNSDNNKLITRDTAPFDLVWKRFLATHVAKFSRQNTISNYDKVYTLIKNDITLLGDFTRENIIKSFLQKKHLPSTRKTYLIRLSIFQEWAKKNSINVNVDFDYISDAILTKVDNDKQFLSVEQYRAILEWFEKRGDLSKALLIELLAERGFRVREIINSDMNDIDDFNNTITIRAGIEKNHKNRTVNIGAEFIAKIKRIRESYIKKDTNAIFIDEKTGGRLQYDTLHKWWSKACAKLNITKRTIHRLRALAFYLIYKSSGHNLELTKQVCGWQSSAFRHYVGSMGDELPSLSKSITQLAKGIHYSSNNNSLICASISKAIMERDGFEKLIAEGFPKSWLEQFTLSTFNAEITRFERFAKNNWTTLQVVSIR